VCLATNIPDFDGRLDNDTDPGIFKGNIAVAG